MKPIDAYLILGVFEGNIRMVASAVRQGANVNARYRGRTVLLWAIQEEHPNIMKALIHAGASLEARDELGFSPLGQAVGQAANRGGNHDFEVVEFLLKVGANVNGRSDSGSPLHKACAYRHLKTVKLLLAYGANPLARDEDGRTPSDFTKIKPNRIDKAIRKLLSAAISFRNKI